GSRERLEDGAEDTRSSLGARPRDTGGVTLTAISRPAWDTTRPDEETVGLRPRRVLGLAIGGRRARKPPQSVESASAEVSPLPLAGVPRTGTRVAQPSAAVNPHRCPHRWRCPMRSVHGRVLSALVGVAFVAPMAFAQSPAPSASRPAPATAPAPA